MTLRIYYTLMWVLLPVATGRHSGVYDFQEAIKYYQQLKRMSYDDLQNSGKTLSEVVSAISGVMPSILTSDVRFIGEGGGNHTCMQDLVQSIDDISKAEMYSMSMWDASGKLPSGVIQGNFLWLGKYDECHQVVAPSPQNFTGKYCLVSLNIPQIGVAAALFTKLYGICVPDSCKAEDITASINQVLKLLSSVSALQNITVTETACAEAGQWSTGGYITISILSLFGFACLVGTLIDFWLRCRGSSRSPEDLSSCTLSESLTNPESLSRSESLPDDNLRHRTIGIRHQPADHDMLLPPEGDLENVVARGVHKGPWSENIPTQKKISSTLCRILLSFSWITNSSKLLNTHIQPGSLPAIHGVRVLSMWWVILGHTYVMCLLQIENLTALPALVKRFSFQAIVNATFSVDTFFFLSGLLLAYLTLKHLESESGKINWALFYFHRFWRLTPVYMVVLMFYTTLMHLLFGPSGIFTQQDDVACTEYWWTNLLYINNFIPSSKTGGLEGMCMAWSWYLANDMQFFVISPILLYLTFRWHYVGLAVTGSLLVAGMAATGIFVRIHHLGSILTGAAGNDINSDVYVKPMYRIPAYLVGFLAGYVMYKTKGKISLNKYYHDNKTMGLDLNAFYSAVSRPAWCVGLSWVTIACLTGYGGPVNAFLSWRVWIPLSRLTYCAYLVHPIVISVTYSQLRTPIYYTDLTMVYYFIGHLVLSYMVAFGTSMLVEAPLMALEKMIFPSRGQGTAVVMTETRHFSRMGYDTDESDNQT